jgi:hypothetical protein
LVVPTGRCGATAGTGQNLVDDRGAGGADRRGDLVDRGTGGVDQDARDVELPSIMSLCFLSASAADWCPAAFAP